MALVVRIQNSEMVSSHQSSMDLLGIRSGFRSWKPRVYHSWANESSWIVLDQMASVDTTSCEALFLPWIWHVSSLIIRYYKVDRLQCGALSSSFLLICWPQIMKKSPSTEGRSNSSDSTNLEERGIWAMGTERRNQPKMVGKKNIQNDDFNIFSKKRMFFYTYYIPLWILQ